MVNSNHRCFGVKGLAGGILGIAILLSCTQAQAADDRPSNAARLKYLQQNLSDMLVAPTEKDDPRELKFQMAPLLRYNDAAREIADSVVFRLGKEGRPVALVAIELYGGQGRQFILNHEFLAISDPRLRMHCGPFTWTPAKGSDVRFQKFENGPPPAATAAARLAQMKQMSSRFSARETWKGQETELRLMPTPIDRYVPSNKPNADAAIFAFSQGVNPEALLFRETDGQEWLYGWARLSRATVVAKLDETQVWEAPFDAPNDVGSAAYTATRSTVTVPLELETDEKQSDSNDKTKTK